MSYNVDYFYYDKKKKTQEYKNYTEDKIEEIETLSIQDIYTINLHAFRLNAADFFLVEYMGSLDENNLKRSFFLIDVGSKRMQIIRYIRDFLGFSSDGDEKNQDLTAVIISHPHFDHYRGLTRISKFFKIPYLIISGLKFRSYKYPTPYVKFIKKHSRNYPGWWEEIDLEFSHDVPLEDKFRTLNYEEFNMSNLEILYRVFSEEIQQDAPDPFKVNIIKPPEILEELFKRKKKPLFPSNRSSDYNNSSLVLGLMMDNFKLLFPGDLQTGGTSFGGLDAWMNYLNDDLEMIEFLERGPQEKKEYNFFYKVSHHGSINGTPKNLLEKLNDRINNLLKFSLITANGEGINLFHPNEKILTVLREITSNYFTTQSLYQKNYRDFTENERDTFVTGDRKEFISIIFQFRKDQSIPNIAFVSKN